ncbi:MAG: hypothetical protein K6F86_09000 [Lachnospiraceae bacterium]|nr:hypothetical protein [Lachnospiraceae bacterium]
MNLFQDKAHQLKVKIRDSRFYRNSIQSYYQILLKNRLHSDELKTESFGPANPDKTFFVIRSCYPAQGTFERWMEAAYNLIYANYHGYIPIVDLKNFQYIDGKNAEEDLWGVYYKQPQYDYTLEEIYNSQNVIFGNRHGALSNVIGIFNPMFVEMDEWMHSMFHECFEIMGFNDEICEYIKANTIELPPKTIGIPLRRSFEWGNEAGVPLYSEYFGHHTRGFMDDYIRWINKEFDKGNYDYCYVTSDDREGLDILRGEFGNRCLFFERKRPHFFCEGKPTKTTEERFVEFPDLPMKEKIRLLGKEYCTETAILAKCDSIMKIRCGQEIMAQIISPKYIPLVDNDVYLKIYR